MSLVLYMIGCIVNASMHSCGTRADGGAGAGQLDGRIGHKFRTQRLTLGHRAGLAGIGRPRENSPEFADSFDRPLSKFVDQYS